MLFTRVALSALTLSPIVGVLAGHSSPRGFVTRPYGTGHKGTSRRDVISVAATFTTAQSQMDKLLSEAGTHLGRRLCPREVDKPCNRYSTHH